MLRLEPAAVTASVIPMHQGDLGRVRVMAGLAVVGHIEVAWG